MSDEDEDEFKRLLLGMEEFVCALCANVGCMGYKLTIEGNQCELVYYLCWTCRTLMKHQPPPAKVFRTETSLAGLRACMFDAPMTATDSKVYTFVRN